MKRLVLLALCFCQFYTSELQAKEDSSDAEYRNKIDELMQYSFDKGIFNGNALVTKEGRVIYQKSFGYTDGSQKTKLTESSLFSPGSIGKEFVAVSVMMLAERGQLSLEDKLSKFDLGLPEWSKKVTIKHLLNYVGGLPKIDYENTSNEEDILKDLQDLQSLIYPPGTDFNYNNNSIFLQKKIIEKVTKQSFQTFVTENIVVPLGMQHVAFDPEFGYPNRTRSFNVHKENAAEFSRSKGWMWVSIGGLNKWVNALHSNQLISENSLKMLLKNQYFENKKSVMGSSNEDYTLHLHGGQYYQFEAAFIWEKENNQIMALMSNNKSKSFEIIQSIQRILKGKSFVMPKKSIYRQVRQKAHENIDMGIEYYKQLKKADYSTYDFENPNELNSLGYDLLTSNKITEAIKIFSLAVIEFPKDANLYDSLAEGYYTNNQSDLALHNYKKSLRLNPDNDNAKKMIEKLTSILK